MHITNGLRYLYRTSPSDMLVDAAYRMKWKGSGAIAERIEHKRLRQLPRYSNTDSKLFGRPIEILDPVSYLFMVEEIFRNEIYFFDCDVVDPLIIDGGANVGLASIYFKRLYPSARIIAFEPDVSLASSMRKNLAAFDIADVQVIEKALWNENTTLRFFAEGSDGGRVASLADDKESIIEIDAVALGAYLTQPVDFLKWDIEGAEWEVLSCVEPELEVVQRIFVEYHSFVGKPQKLGHIVTLLERSGFRLNVTSPVERASRPMARRRRWNGMDLQLNIFGWREPAA